MYFWQCDCNIYCFYKLNHSYISLLIGTGPILDSARALHRSVLRIWHLVFIPNKQTRCVGSLYEKKGCEQNEYSLWRHRFTDCSVEVTLRSDHLGCQLDGWRCITRVIPELRYNFAEYVNLPKWVRSSECNLLPLRYFQPICDSVQYFVHVDCEQTIIRVMHIVHAYFNTLGNTPHKGIVFHVHTMTWLKKELSNLVILFVECKGIVILCKLLNYLNFSLLIPDYTCSLNKY